MGNQQQAEIIEVLPRSLVGAADYLRQEYIREGLMTKDQALLLRNPETGEYDIARPLTDDERVQRRLDMARTKQDRMRIAQSYRAKKEARRKREWRKRKSVTVSPILRAI